MAVPDTPLFVKTHDFLLWLVRHTQRFPKNLRHTLTHRLESMALEFQEAILMANAARGQARIDWLVRADGRLVCLRALLRLASSLQLLGGNQIKYAAERVDERVHSQNVVMQPCQSLFGNISCECRSRSAAP